MQNSYGLKKYVLHGFAVTLFFAVMLGFSGCSAKEPYYDLITDEEIAGFDSLATENKYSAEDFALDKMVLVTEQDGNSLYFNESTTDIAIVTAEGNVFYSNHPDNYEVNKDELRSSQIVVSTLDGRDIPKNWNSFMDSVRYDQFKFEIKENGVSVTYLLGKKPEIIRRALGLTEQRLEEILNSIENEKDKAYLKKMYGRIEFEKIESEQAKTNLTQQFTKLEELGVVYSLKIGLSKLESKKIEKILDDIQYDTKEQDEIDVGLAVEGGAKDMVLVTVDYSLDKGDLVVDIDPSKIKTTKSLMVSDISVMKQFGTHAGLESGFFVIPDGSGAIIDLTEVRNIPYTDYNKKVYGNDLGVLNNDKFSYPKQIYFPMFAMGANNAGFIAVAEKGDASMSILAGTPRAEADYGFCYPKFTTLSYTNVTIESSKNSSLNLYPKKAFNDELRMRYIFTSKDNENIGYDDLAVMYRNYLLENEKITLLDDKATENRNVAVVDIICAIDDVRSFMGIPRDETIKLTSYKEAGEFAELLNAEVGNTAVRLKGWQAGGVRTGYAKKPTYESKLGGKKDFAELESKLSLLGIDFMPDSVLQYVGKNTLFDGFTASEDSIKFISREVGYKTTYNLANFYIEKDEKSWAIIAPDKLDILADSYIENYDISGISAGSMTSEIYADYSRDNLTSRNETAKIFAGILEKYNEKAGTLGGDGANAYALKYLDYAFGTPYRASNNPLIKKSVPFMQIVLSGCVTYTMPPLNYEDGSENYVLKAIETGSSVYFDYFEADGSLVKPSSYNYYYAAAKNSISGEAISASREVKLAFDQIGIAVISGHREIADEVFVTEYDNGKAVVTNYSDIDIFLGGINVPAKDYVVTDKSALADATGKDGAE